MLKIASWNVNGIRACAQKGMVDWLQRECPHILCLQETRVQPHQLPPQLVNIPPYTSHFFSAQKKGYSGVALYLHPSLAVRKITPGLGIERFDREGRTLILEFGRYVLINGYYPNGQRELQRVPFKLQFSRAMLKRALQYRRQKKRVILCGDFNTAHHSIDLANPRQNIKTTGFLPSERAFLDHLTQQGFVDAFRHCHPHAPHHYTWWSYRNNCRSSNIGWRIDYFFVSKSLIPHLATCYHRPQILGSDHCPLVLQLKNVNP